MEKADERALRRELEELTRKRERLDAPKRGNRVEAGVDKRRSMAARLGGAGGSRQAQLKENSVRVNGPRRLGKRSDDDRFNARAGNTIKRQRLLSAVARPQNSSAQDDSSDEERRGRATETAAAASGASGAPGIQRKQRAVAPYAHKDGIARNRRMFGALMGHLGKAKQRIEKDTDLFKRQGSRQQEAELKEKAQTESLASRARRDATVGRLETLIARTELDQSEQRARAKLEHLQMMRKSAGQSKFLVTVASPPIYYRPAKHTKETEDLVAASMEAHEAKMRSSARDLEATLRKLDVEFQGKLEKLRAELEEAKKDTEESEKKEMDGEVGPAADGSSVKEDESMVGENEVEVQSPRNEASDAPMLDDAEAPVEAEERKEEVAGAVKQEQGAERSSAKKEEEKSHPQDKEEMASPTVQEEEQAETLSPTAKEEKPEQVEAEVRSSPENLQQDEEAVVDAPEPDVSNTDDAGIAAEAQEDRSRAPKTPARSTKMPALNLSKMRVTDLRKELKQRGLDTKGLKADLLQRLETALHEQESDD